MAKKLSIAIMIIALLCVVVLCACDKGDNEHNNNSNSNNNNNQENLKSYSFSVDVRNASFVPIEGAEIIYDGKSVGLSNSEGGAECSVMISGNIIPNKIGIFGRSYILKCPSMMDSDGTPIESPYFQIIVLQDGDSLQDFFYISGKIVTHSDGETVEYGVSLTLDGNEVHNTDNGRDYGIIMRSGSTLSAHKDGYDFVDIAAIPYNDVVFNKEDLSATTEVTDVIFNGEDATIKCLGGVTFRAKGTK